MISVIIPTMWKYPPFIRFLIDILEVPSVGQVIIINNDVNSTPQLIEHDKLMVLNQPKNIYVNPAWNLGVEKAAFNKICLMNDDIIFDTKLFHFMNKVIQPGDGVYGMVSGEEQFGQPGLIDGNIDIHQCNTPYHAHTHFGFGQLMFLNKNQWTPIPDGLNIYWGDNFIYDTLYYKLNKNFIFFNFFFKTPNSATCTTLNEDIFAHLMAERDMYNQIMPNILNEIHYMNKHKTGLTL